MNEKQLFKLCFSAALGAGILNAGNIVASPKSTALQQAVERQVGGVVLDENGDPVIGATVTVKGQKAATVTDIDGKFSLKVPTGSTLVISYLGYEPKEVKAQSDNITVKLSQNTQNINEVVVTALGIKKEAKSLSYNVQQLNSDAVTTVKDANFVNSLNGKVAGVQFTQSSSGVGGATRVVMRGAKSLNGNNNVLYVIDGIPMTDNSSSGASGIFEGAGQTGDAISLMNSDDIESISVLTGPSAAALYGANASNGVILVTTKKGKKGKVEVTYSGSFQFSEPFKMHEFQNQYGPTEANSYYSWGAKLDTPSTYNPKNFFQTGANIMNDVSLSVGSDRNQTYVSFGATNANGILPTNDLDRYNLTFRNTTNFLNDRLTLDFNYMISTAKEQNMISQGQYHNPLVPVYLFPAGDDFSKLEFYERYDTDRNFPVQYWPYANDMSMENPYWELNRERYSNHKQRQQFSVQLNWKITPWLDFTGRVKYDRSENKYEYKFYASTNLLYASEYGAYKDRRDTYETYYAESFLKLNKYFAQDRWNLNAVAGANYTQNSYDPIGFEGHLLGTPNIFTFENVNKADNTFKVYQDDAYRNRLGAIFGTAQLGYKSLAYLDVTARNDWSSKLEKNYFYWSAGISAIWTDIFPQITKGGWLNYFKTRLSYAEVGNEPSQSRLVGVGYTINPSTGRPETTTTLYDNLNPEKTKSWELGIDFVLLQNKLKLNATLYKSKTYNQFFNIDMPASSGYTSAWVNGGVVENKGLELSARYNQRLGAFNWETYLTWTLNRNEVKEMLDSWKNPIDGNTYSLDVMYKGGTSGYQTRIQKGGSMADIYVRTLKTDEHGAIWVDSDNKTVEANPDGNEYYTYAGKATPNYNLSWGNTFSWKGLSLGFLFTYRNGGVVVSETQAILDYYGASKASQDARNNGGAVVNGKLIPAKEYYQVVGNPTKTIDAMYTYSATNLRLQELSLGYDVPVTKWVPWIKGLNLSFVAHNLWMLYCKAPFDPELTANTGTYSQGIDYFMQPSLRNMGFSVKVKF